MANKLFTFDEIFDAAVKVTNSTRSDVMGPGRTSSISFARMVTVGCLRDLVGGTPPSFPEIAEVLGSRHHSTYWYSYKRWCNCAERKRFTALTRAAVAETRRTSSIN